MKCMSKALDITVSKCRYENCNLINLAESFRQLSSWKTWMGDLVEMYVDAEKGLCEAKR